MQVIYLIVGAVIGLFVGQNGLGAVAGAAVGYLFGELLQLKNKTKAAEEQLKILTAKLKSLQAGSSDDSIDDLQEKQTTQEKDPYYSDKYLQAIKKSALESEQSKMTVPEVEANIETSISLPSEHSEKSKQYKKQESAISQGICKTSKYGCWFFYLWKCFGQGWCSCFIFWFFIFNQACSRKFYFPS